MIMLLAAVLLSVATVGHTQLECGHCDGVTSVDECQYNNLICGPNEECFLERVTDNQLRVVINGGCRSKTVCQVMQMLGQQPNGKRETVNCVQCCNGSLCNTRLCGQKPSQPFYENECYVCDYPVTSAYECTTTAVCPDTQVCSTTVIIAGGNRIRFTYGCEERHICAYSAQNNVKRTAAGANVCSACCYGHLCNRQDCFQMRKNMTVAGLGTNPPPISG